MTKRIHVRTIDAIHLDAKHKLEDLKSVLDALLVKQKCSSKMDLQLDKDIQCTMNEINYHKHLMDIIEEHLL